MATLYLQRVVMCDPNLHFAAKRMFAILAGYSDKEGKCFPALATIARELGQSVPAVRKQIKILENTEYLDKRPQFYKSGGQRSNMYYINHDLAKKLHAEEHGV